MLNRSSQCCSRKLNCGEFQRIHREFELEGGAPNLEHGESGGGTRARSSAPAGGMVPRCGQLVRASTHPAAAPYRSPKSPFPSATSTPSSRWLLPSAPSSSLSFPWHKRTDPAGCKRKEKSRYNLEGGV